MRNIGKLIVLLSLMIVMTETQAQTVLDGAYIRENTLKRRVIPYAPLREADVTYSKRIWRTIDMREKINLAFYYPLTPTNDRKALIDVIHSALSQGVLTAYDNATFDDEFKSPMTKSEVEAKFVHWDSTHQVPNPNNPDEMIAAPLKTTIGAEQTKQYLIKEDWFFDKQRSVLDVRIIGICPQIENRSESGEIRGYARLFWLYYPEARNVFANYEVYNRKNDEERRTYEDIFWKRQFSSFIYKESNVFDRTIQDVFKSDGITALLESDRIKAELFNWEHDLWHF